MLIREALRRNGVAGEVVVKMDGESAEDFLDELDRSDEMACPGIVLVDLNLPKKNGIEVIRRIRGLRRCGHIPVLVLSSSDAPPDREAAAAAGADQYLRKPSRLDEFMRIGATVQAMLAGPA